MLVPKFLGQIYLNFKPETKERKRYREREGTAGPGGLTGRMERETPEPTIADGKLGIFGVALKQSRYGSAETKMRFFIYEKSRR